jgi:hypothetical protein
MIEIQKRIGTKSIRFSLKIAGSENFTQAL